MPPRKEEAAMTTIAQTLRDQIGSRTFAMLGAPLIVAMPNGLMFGIGTNAKKVTKLVITLDPSDTYTVKAYAGRGVKIREVEAVSDVYADCLHRTIESMTGMYTSL
jgi:hypothetical protein